MGSLQKIGLKTDFIIEKEGVRIHLCPGVVVTPEHFLSDQFPMRSIALDGFCGGGPIYEPELIKFNFDHHSGVPRLSTRASCEQAKMAICAELMDLLKVKGQILADIWINDVDQDTALAVWLLLNPKQAIIPTVNALINLEEHLDATAGAFPVDIQSKVMRGIFWVFEPYDLVRVSPGGLSNQTVADMANLLEAIMARISVYAVGQGQRICAQTDYEILKSGYKWVLIKEIGPHARYGFFNDGIKSYALYLGQNKSTGSYRYTIGKKSNLAEPDFKLFELYAYLNALEGILPDDPDRWNGSDFVGGSPRGRGSKLSPDELFTAIENYLKEKKATKLAS